MRNRALIDGNKRFGRLATVVLQGLNGIRLETTMFQLVIGACFSAGRQLSIRRGCCKGMVSTDVHYGYRR